MKYEFGLVDAILEIDCPDGRRSSTIATAPGDLAEFGSVGAEPAKARFADKSRLAPATLAIGPLLPLPHQ